MNPRGARCLRVSLGKVSRQGAPGRAGSLDRAGQGLHGRIRSPRPSRLLDRADQGLLTGQHPRQGRVPMQD